MAEWIEPIFDRTQDDVSSAIRLIEEWKKNGFSTTHELKGCLNVTDINRIENNIQFLSDNLSSLYYFSKVETKTSDRSTLLDIREIERIIGNLRILINSYYQSLNAPDVPDTMLTFEHINDIEENLYLIKNMITDMISSFRECGTFNCGED